MTKKNFFDDPEINKQIILQNDFAAFISNDGFLEDGVLTGSGMIIPKEYVETPFDFKDDQILGIFHLLKQIKKHLDTKYEPEGYNIGWNVGSVGGQNVSHLHLHVIPRYSNEPLAGKGIRFALKRQDKIAEII